MGMYYHEPMERLRRGLPIDVTPISDAKATFLGHTLNRYKGRFVRFHMTAKVQKPTLKLRPIVSCVGIFSNDWRK